MKRALIAVLLAFLLAPALCNAQPYIVCDPDPSASAFRVRLSADNGQTWGAWAESPPVQQAMKFDLRPVAGGNYRGEAQAQATWSVTDDTSGVTTTSSQWSASAPFHLIVPKGRPTNQRVVDGN